MTGLRALSGAIVTVILGAGCGADLTDDPAALGTTVEIQTVGCQPIQVGTGFVVEVAGAGAGADAIVVTAAHVVAGATEISVTHADRTVDATPVIIDTDLDVALLRATDLDVVPFRLASRLVRATSAVAVPRRQTPLAAPLRQTAWAVTTDIHRDHEVTKLVLELGLRVEVGDSGAPVMDGIGEVAGVVVSTARDREVTFALHVEEFAALLRDVPEDRAPRGSCSR